MLRRSFLLTDSFKEHYHRVHLPRRLAFQRFVKKEKDLARKKGGVVAGTAAAAGPGASPSADSVAYKYNRWWVSNDHEFVHQFAFIEDPDVIRERRNALPVITAENIWKEPQKTYFMPFAPYARVVDYAKDPDSKFLKPINIPRWKDYMQRKKPVIPRTWY